MKKVAVLLLLTVSAVHGEGIFTWTDSRGTAHYTNKEDEVPPRYRSKVKVLDMGTGQKTDIQLTQPEPQVRQAQPAAQEEPRQKREHSRPRGQRMRRTPSAEPGE